MKSTYLFCTFSGTGSQFQLQAHFGQNVSSSKYIEQPSPTLWRGRNIMIKQLRKMKQ